MKKRILCTLVVSILLVPILVEGRGGGGAAAPSGHASAATGTSGMSATTSTTSGGVPLGTFPSGAPREYYTTNAEGQVVVGTLPANKQTVLAPQPSGPPVASGQPALPYGAANQASAQMQFEAELAKVNEMEGHASPNQFGSETNASENVQQP